MLYNKMGKSLLYNLNISCIKCANQPNLINILQAKIQHLHMYLRKILQVNNSFKVIDVDVFTNWKLQIRLISRKGSKKKTGPGDVELKQSISRHDPITDKQQLQHKSPICRHVLESKFHQETLQINSLAEPVITSCSSYSISI